MSAPRSSIRPADVGASLPDLALAGVFLAVWVTPGSFPRGTVTYLMLLMLLEFIIVHSSGFMGTLMLSSQDRRRKGLAMLGLGAFYTLFVGGFAIAFKVWWPLWSFWGLTLNRMLGMLIGQAPEGEERVFLQRGWAVSCLCYLGFVFVTIILPIPRLGITPDILAAEAIPGGGLWVSQPQRVIVFGCLYFAAVGISELFAHRWLPMGGAPAVGTQRQGT